MPPNYTDSPLWSDITPIPLDEGPGPGPALASIAYTPRYATAMSYLRAVMAQNEYSDRALSLTEDIISMNPAHYTVWLYRAKIIREMGKDALEELAWLEGISRKSLKNYQIWHHRQTLISLLSSPPPSEPSFLSRILALDSKNYHVWTYRQWLVNHFDLFDSPDEFSAVEMLLREDVRNNSAWNHRWFLCFGREELRERKTNPRSKTATGGGGLVVIDEDLIDREIAFAKEKIVLAPQNQSPWNYLRGLFNKSGRRIGELSGFAEQFITTSKDNSAGEEEQAEEYEEGVSSSHALDLLADIYAQEGEIKKAKRVLESLGRKWDPIRKGYWDWRAGLLDKEEKGDDLGGSGDSVQQGGSERRVEALSVS